MELSTQAVKKIVREELPGLMKKDKRIRKFILDLSKKPWDELNEKTDKLEKQTESRFDLLLDELRKDREEQSRKWEEQSRKWEEQNKKWKEKQAEDNRKWEEQNNKWEEQNKKWEEKQAEDNRKWEEQNKKWEEQNKKWKEKQAEDNRKWEEQNKKWEEKQAEDNRKWEENQKMLIKLHQKHDSTLGALGARWGLRSESSFRNALKNILKDFDVKVLNTQEYDEKGEVFGRPEQIELDIIIINGKLMVCEIKSSMSRADMYTFYKKAKFYERIHQKEADRYIVISPMVEDRAKDVAKDLGIAIYSYAEEMEEELEGK